MADFAMLIKNHEERISLLEKQKADKDAIEKLNKKIDTKIQPEQFYDYVQTIENIGIKMKIDYDGIREDNKTFKCQIKEDIKQLKDEIKDDNKLFAEKVMLEVDKMRDINGQHGEFLGRIDEKVKHLEGMQAGITSIETKIDNLKDNKIISLRNILFAILGAVMGVVIYLVEQRITGKWTP